jgi:hypothetical protein
MSALASGLVMVPASAVNGAMAGTLLGALLGALRGGLTGPEVERRVAPNQGIRQSATNVGVFALLGGLIAGTIFAVLNLALIAMIMRRLPQPSDWLRLELSGVLLLAALSALVPGAACIQHFALRFILWCYGAIPLDYVRFLDYATKRMLLQRVGGRYRFIHELLQKHFAEMDPERRDAKAYEASRVASIR